MPLAQVIHQLATNDAFRALMKADPKAALAGAGLNLSDEEMRDLTPVLQGWSLTESGPGWWLWSGDPSPMQPRTSTAG